MKRALGLVLLVLLAGCSGTTPSATPPVTPAASPSPTLPPENPAPGDHATAFFDHEGKVRRYIVHAPPGYQTGKTYPLVLVFHGSPGAAEDMPKLTKMNEVADANGFLVVYPHQMSETKMIAALLDHLTPKWGVDPKRVHVAGFSRGATFTYELAEKLTDRFGSVAPVSGTGGTGQPLSKPLSLLTFQGGHDRLKQGFTTTNDNWAKAAGCSGEKLTTITMENGPTHIHTSTCAGGAEHVVYDVTAMSHEWPADGSKLIWEFFKKHPLA
jgi:polyhydroxybutyrate depolymerase